MRLQLGSSNSSFDDVRDFSEWVLKVGDGHVCIDNDGEKNIEIPTDCPIHDLKNHVTSIVRSTYPSIVQSMFEPRYFEDRAILAPTHEIVDTVNDYLLSVIDGDIKVYLSSDSISVADKTEDFDTQFFSVGFLNTIRSSGLPNHKLSLKIGVPIMLLRNINQSEGLCNGSRLQVNRFDNHVIEAKVITGPNINQKVFIPRMLMTTKDNKFPFMLQRRQFPIALCFAMTINKSQGQSLSKFGLYLPRPVFSHGQLYVALSRVKSKEGLKIFICDKDGERSNKTTNVVYKEVFSNID